MTEALRIRFARRLAAKRNLALPEQDTAHEAALANVQTIPRVPEGTLLPMSYAQERMWFLHQLDPAASAYNVCVKWHLRGVLNRTALEKSVARLVERHSILRTLYVTDAAGQGRQRVLRDLPAEWRCENLRDLSPQPRHARLEEIAQQASTAPFDLSSRSTLRLVLVALADTHHVLVMVGQHIVWDGPSFGVFCRELASGYNLFASGKTDRRPQLKTQYSDFAHIHRQTWQGSSPKRDAELAFWETRLSPLPEPINFPTDFEPGATNDEAGAWCTETVDENTTAALAELAAQERTTPFVVLISAIAVLMTRLARASEVTIGTIASHRGSPELQDGIGNFGNVVPLRIAVCGDSSFRQLVRQCAECCTASFSHAEIPLECLLDHFQIARGQRSSPLLDTMVTFLSRGMEAPAMDGLEVHWEKHFNGTSQLDLSFDALLMHGTLQLQATWRTSVFRTGTVENHLRRLATLLRACVTDPDMQLAQRSLLLPEERAQLLGPWGRRAALAAKADTLVAWFEQTVCGKPNEIAIRGPAPTAARGKASLSFSELNARANRLARWLSARGIGPETRVALVLPRRAEWFVAMLATLKAGASFVPIDPSYPAKYIDLVLEQAQPELRLVAQDPKSEGAPSQSDEASIELSAAERMAKQAGLSDRDLVDADRQRSLTPAHPAYVVFTSGSSGQPKGVVVSHAAVVNLLSSHRQDLYEEAYRLTGRRRLRVGHAWSLAFDAAWQPTLWMFEGHEIHLFDTDVMQDPIELARQILLRRLDFIELTPGMLEVVLPWLQAGLPEADGTHLPGHVPAVLGFGGEAVKHALWERIVGLRGTTGFNLYGPTEATVDAMIARAEANQPPNIGRPVAGAQVYVLDHSGQLAPPGVPGELAIGGAGLARGYLGRSDLTASQFIPNRFGAPGSRLYRTGDRVRWLPSGRVEYLGRIDEQLKIRGFRVEPLEVEVHVEKLVGRRCAVVARAAASGEMQLLCFIETTGERDVFDAETLQRKCAASLPSHLSPQHFVAVERMPRLPNGKIDRRSLQLPIEIEKKAERKPRTPIEVELCQLFCEVLGRAGLGIDDGFFESGGDSISVVKLVSQARRRGITLTARQVFSARTVAEIARQLDDSDVAAAGAEAEHDPGDTGSIRPTPLMMRYLALGQPLRRFAQIVSMPLPPGVSDAELAHLLDALIARHAMLRAHLLRSDQDVLRLHVPDEPHPRVSAPTLRLQSSNHRITNHAKEIGQVLCEALDPDQGRMLAAARVLGLGEEGEDHLCLAIHHLVIDASSWHVLAADLALARAAQERGEAIELPPVPTAYRTWSIARSEQGQEATQPLSAGAPGTLASACRASWVLAPVAEECPATVASRRLGAPLAALLPALTGLAVLEAGLLPDPCQRTVCLVVEQHGREPSAHGHDLSRTVGWFAQELRLRLHGPATPAPLSAAHEAAWTTLVKRWCGAILQLGLPGDSADRGETPQATTHADFQLGFNFLGELMDPRQREAFVPKPRLDWLVEACGADWPLLHDLDVSAYYDISDGKRVLRFEAMSALYGVDHAALDRLFAALHSLVHSVAGTHPQRSVAGGGRWLRRAPQREVTPLQYEMLRHRQGDTDPWTTQMELTVVASPDTTLSAAALQRSSVQLLARHDALSAGFVRTGASTFFAKELEPHWEILDLRDDTAQRQHTRLRALRRRCYATSFRLEEPPLLRFAAAQLDDNRLHLMMNCHHLLMDGWSVPRTMRDWLGGACGLPLGAAPTLSYQDYLDFLQRQERAVSIRYFDRALRGLSTPSLLRPGRTKRYPSRHAYDALTVTQSQVLKKVARNAGVSGSALYQLAWAHTLAQELGQPDVVFGLFDSGRSAAAALAGLEALVGLVTQLVPVRIRCNAPSSERQQLTELQAAQLEWQFLPPVRLDSLQAHHAGEFFDTLLVIENALTADSEVSATEPIPGVSLESQRFHDSIGQVVGLFVYPGEPVELRLCHDPSVVESETAERLLLRYRRNLCHLLTALGADPMAMGDLTRNSPRRLSPIPSDGNDDNE